MCKSTFKSKYNYSENQINRLSIREKINHLFIYRNKKYDNNNNDT
jgi:hypothetical protein